MNIMRHSSSVELICAASVIAIFIIGAVASEPIKSVIAAALVPVVIGLLHRIIVSARRNKDG